MLDPDCLYEKQSENGIFTALFLPLKSILQQETCLVEFLMSTYKACWLKPSIQNHLQNVYPLIPHSFHLNQIKLK